MNLGGAIRLNKLGLLIITCTLLILFIYLFSKNRTNEIVPNTLSLQRLLETSILAAQIGGLEVVKVKDDLKIKSKGKTKEGAEDSVTTADFKSHCSMIRTLKKTFPSIVIVSEEAKTDCNNYNGYSEQHIESMQIPQINDDVVHESDVTIWIDPLDATKEYTEKLYKYVTTMVCVAVKGKPVIGVIHKPFFKNTSWAWVDVDESVDLKTIKPKEEKNGKLTVTVSRSHSGQIKEILERQFKDIEIIPAAGAGYKALEVATGKVDAYLHVTAIKKWDICAGNAILNAVGGKLTTSKNKIIDYSDQINVVNEEGLIATLRNHDLFVNKL